MFAVLRGAGNDMAAPHMLSLSLSGGGHAENRSRFTNREEKECVLGPQITVCGGHAQYVKGTRDPCPVQTDVRFSASAGSWLTASSAVCMMTEWA